MTILTGALCVSCPWVTHPVLALGFSVVLLVALAFAVLTLVRGSRRTMPTRWLLWLLAALAGAGVVVTALLAAAQGANLGVVAVLTATVFVLGAEPMMSRSSPSMVRLAFPALAYLGLVVLLTAGWDGSVDVRLFVQGGLEALAGGTSPYGITVDNVYSPELAELYYGPGVVEGDRVAYGFPYLPAVLLIDLPAHLLADAVWMHLMVIAGASALAWRLASDRLGRAAVMMLALSPSLPFLLVNYYVEPVMIGLLAVVVWGMSRDRKWAVIVGLGFFFSSKQYAVFYLPAVWPVVRSVGWLVVASAAGLGVLLVGGFLLMDPQAFYRSVVELQLIQPFRDDSVSLLPVIKDTVGHLPSWTLVVLPLSGIAVSALVAVRVRPGPTSFALCVGLGLLVSVLFAKQAFANYYLLCGAALLLAGVTWPDDDPVRPVQMREPSSQGSRGARGISRTR